MSYCLHSIHVPLWKKHNVCVCLYFFLNSENKTLEETFQILSQTLQFLLVTLLILQSDKVYWSYKAKTLQIGSYEFALKSSSVITIFLIAILTTVCKRVWDLDLITTPVWPCFTSCRSRKWIFFFWIIRWWINNTRIRNCIFQTLCPG